MKYAKLIEGRPVFAPNPIIVEGFLVGNPPADIYTAQGYKPVVVLDQTEAQGDGYFSETWEDNGTEIVQGWKWVTDPSDEGGR